MLERKLADQGPQARAQPGRRQNEEDAEEEECDEEEAEEGDLPEGCQVRCLMLC